MEKTTEPSTGVQYEQEADRGGWYMTLPGSNTPIHVRMDYSQTSRKAYERQRKAKASRKCRQKRKVIQGENIRQLQELRDELRQMSEEVDHLRRQRDFYQQEINQLRHIVCRTPGIHQHAAWYRNPILTTSVGSHTDQSPVFQHLMPTPTQDYASNLGSVDCAVQRPKKEQRTNHAESGFPPNMAPTGLAAPHGHLYSDPPRSPSSAASSASGNRQPLRAMEGPLPTIQHIGPGQEYEQTPRIDQWHPVPSGQVKSGWATGPIMTGYDDRTHIW